MQNSVADPHPHNFGLLDPHPESQYKSGSVFSYVKISAEI
jgi:hypothetical protein